MLFLSSHDTGQTRIGQCREKIAAVATFCHCLPFLQLSCIIQMLYENSRIRVRFCMNRSARYFSARTYFIANHVGNPGAPCKPPLAIVKSSAWRQVQAYQSWRFFGGFNMSEGIKIRSSDIKKAPKRAFFLYRPSAIFLTLSSQAPCPRRTSSLQERKSLLSDLRDD
jgi:hypothetical protein